MRFVIGVDAGATSTVACLADETGCVRGIAQSSGVNLVLDGVDGTCDSIVEAIKSVLLLCGIRLSEVAVVCVGCAGAGDVGDPVRQLLRDKFVERLNENIDVLVEHDAAIAHAGALCCLHGIVVISGTGAMSFGIDEDGNSARADGLGHWLGDEGSGFWIGAEALRSWARAFDGRSEHTLLCELLPKVLNLRSPREASVALSTGELSKREVAKLAKVVAEAARAGDKIARSIFSAAADKLADAVCAVADCLGMKCPRVSYSGGVFRAGELLTSPLKESLRRRLSEFKFVKPFAPPVIGATMLALKALHNSKVLSDEITSRLREGYLLWGFDELGFMPPSDEETTLITILPRLMSEQRNPRSKGLDGLSVEEILLLMNDEDHNVAPAVRRELAQVADVVRMAIRALKNGGRIFYVGAGTSGRLGIIDAAECPPTFGTPREWVQGIIAGGNEAVFRSIEGAEDDEQAAADELERRGICERDLVIGLSVSGRTPFVIAALREAKRRGAKTAAITANRDAPIALHADVVIAPNVGPEVIAGSTRLKAGTAEKLILNMISTTTMVKLGRVKDNLMISVRTWSEKLRERAKRITSLIAGVTVEEAEEALKSCGWEIREAVDFLRSKRRHPSN
ncbi:MAG: N-acetylmuramic acid 6-phosphate etherase [Armatimonadota bacterium]|nr:N-acetylmuramic acid 6-phosphate etherase [Armatimonadota bacterium]